MQINWETMPASMRDLPIDKQRAVPVPWFVQWIDGVPEFRAMSPERWALAVKEKRCWVCGEPFQTAFGLSTFAFVIGPMCAVNRVSSEPPSHVGCAVWSAQNCPFLSRPDMVRREDDVTRAMVDTSAGMPILRNPGVTLVWRTTSYHIFRDNRQRPLIRIGVLSQPAQWWAEGRAATRAEVLHSIETSLPALRAACDAEDTPAHRADAHDQLDQQLKTAMRLIPDA